jgi:hypothetical protein
VAGKIYWTASKAIHRSDLDGTHIETVLNMPGFGNAEDLAVDAVGGKLYFVWAYYVFRANLDGSAMEMIYNDGNDPTFLGLDTAGGKVYVSVWEGTYTVQMNLDGSDWGLFIEQRAADIAADPRTGKVYWSNSEWWNPDGGLWRAHPLEHILDEQFISDQVVLFLGDAEEPPAVPAARGGALALLAIALVAGVGLLGRR